MNIYLYIYSTAIEYNKFYSAEFNKNKKFSFKLYLWKSKKHVQLQSLV